LWGIDKQQTSSVWLLTYTTPKYIAVYQSKGHMDPLYIKTNQNPEPSLKVAHPSISPCWYPIQNLYSNYERGSIAWKMYLCLNKAEYVIGGHTKGNPQTFAWKELKRKILDFFYWIPFQWSFLRELVQAHDL
jgi:hypothetical protein